MIATSPDGQWAVVRRGREISLLADGVGPATARVEIETADADLAIVGPPSVVAVVTRAGAGNAGSNCLTLYQPPYLDAVARLDLDVPMRIAGLTGPRLVLVGLDGKAVMVVRIAGRALSPVMLDTGSPVEFAVGLERNQVMFGLLRALEAWDAVSGRPLLRMQLQLPPPPRTVGPAYGHVWATRPKGDGIVVFRLSDGRPFPHQIGAPIDEVICHPASPLLILATPHGLVRVHCFAHALTVLDTPWRPGDALAQLVLGDDIRLLGLSDHDDEPWQVAIGGAGAPAITLPSEAPSGPLFPAGDPPRPPRARTAPELGDPAPPPATGDAAPGAPGDAVQISNRIAAAADAGPAAAAVVDGPPPRWIDVSYPAASGHFEPEPVVRSVVAAPARSVEPIRAPAWREPLAAIAAELVRGSHAELPVVAADTELGELADRLALAPDARRALIVLYGLHLAGEPGLPIARLAHVLGDWSEALGRGELQGHALVRRRGGRLALRGAVADLLDGVVPRAIRVVGAGTALPRPGARRLVRGGRSDAAIESELAAQLGRIAVIDGSARRAVLEAYLQGVTAVAVAAPSVRPAPWPRDAAMIVVADQPAPAWVAALPGITDA